MNVFNKVEIAGTELSISRIALGTDYYGKTIPEETAGILLDRYCEMGGNVIDTAHVYSDYLPGEKHMSEKVIGRWLKKSGRRNQVVIATKGGYPPLADMHRSRILQAEIERDLDSSLRCLDVDIIDIYWLHRDDRQVQAGEIVEWMDKLTKKGKIKHFAVSNWRTERIIEANKYADARGLSRIIASQIKWSLARTKPGAVADDTLVEMDSTEYANYGKMQMPVFAFSPQAKGFYSKMQVVAATGELKVEEGKAKERYYTEENVEVYKKLCGIKDKYGLGITQLALQWLYYAPFEVVPVIGCRTKQQLEDSMKGLESMPEIEEFTEQMKIYGN